MNHIYKVVWSTVTNSLVVVSELARSKGKAASTVSDVKDISTTATAVTTAAALQIAAVATIAVGSFAPVDANAYVAISSTSGGSISSNTITADGNRSVNGVWTEDAGTRAYNYYNPGSLSFQNPNTTDRESNLYNSTLYVHGIALGCNTNVVSTRFKWYCNWRLR